MCSRPTSGRRAIAIWAGFAGIGAVTGNLLSGWLLQNFWWGSVFLINVAIVVAALVAGAFLVPSSKDDHSTTLDPVGAVLSIAGLGTLIYAIIEAPGRGWVSPGTFAAFAVAAVILVAFGMWELHTPDPMLDLRYFANPRFTAATSTITLMFFVIFGTIFILTQYLQLVLGYSPLAAGARVLPWAVVYMITAPLSARMVERWGQRRVVSSGLAIVAVSLAILSRASVHSNFALLATSLVVMAIGQGMATAPAPARSSCPCRSTRPASAPPSTTRPGSSVAPSASPYSGACSPPASSRRWPATTWPTPPRHRSVPRSRTRPRSQGPRALPSPTLPAMHTLMPSMRPSLSARLSLSSRRDSSPGCCDRSLRPRRP